MAAARGAVPDPAQAPVAVLNLMDPTACRFDMQRILVVPDGELSGDSKKTIALSLKLLSDYAVLRSVNTPLCFE